MNESRIELRAERGFSLMELIVVMVSLGLLAGIVTVRFVRQQARAKLQFAQVQIAAIKTGLGLFYLDVGRYPTTREGLEALIRNPGGVPGWRARYLEKTELPLDPWNQPYQYRCPGEHDDFDLFSFGPDGKEGGEGDDADIVSWK